MPAVGREGGNRTGLEAACVVGYPMSSDHRSRSGARCPRARPLATSGQGGAAV